ncbi:response regulator [Variovorax sp. VNK109]|jgi:two-component system chemotaxis response regulator CheY|uniref:response regulator n=1 Tax=Variovorax sp. VNK109 TaxID=3400919 RepID=UPI003C03172B
MKILIADDSRAMRQLIAHMLREAGFRGHQIVEAADGSQALAVAATEKPDVILSDWNMPALTGIEVLSRLRSEGAKTPFGFVTTEVSQEMRTRAQSEGAAFLIGKPFTPDDFRDALEAILD